MTRAMVSLHRASGLAKSEASHFARAACILALGACAACGKETQASDGPPEPDSVGFAWNIEVHGTKDTFERFRLEADNLASEELRFSVNHYVQEFTTWVPRSEAQRPNYVLRAWDSDELVDEVQLRPFVCDSWNGWDEGGEVAAPQAQESHQVVLAPSGEIRLGSDPRWGLLTYTCESLDQTEGTGLGTVFPESLCGEGDDHSVVEVALDGESIAAHGCLSALYYVPPWHVFSVQITTLPHPELGEIVLSAGFCLDAVDDVAPFAMDLSEATDCPIFHGVTWLGEVGEPWNELEFDSGTWEATELSPEPDTRHRGELHTRVTLDDGRVLTIDAAIDMPLYRMAAWDW